MKKIFFSIFLLIFLFPVFSFAEEKIDNFDVVIGLNQDATINVTENIIYDYDNLQSGRERHGLYRDIPYEYQADYGTFNFNFSDVSVNTNNFEYSTYGKYFRMDTNPDPNIHVFGVNTYLFKYKVDGAIGYFDDFDEIYWNTTGDEWDVSIKNATAKIILPIPILENELKISCYEGVRGSKEICSYQLNKNNGFVESIIFSVARKLSPHEGMTIALGFPKGIVYAPTFVEKIAKALWENKIFMLPVLVFLVMFFIWYTKGRDPKGRGVIIPQYDVPDGLTPMEVAVIAYERVKNRDISAEIIYLAIKGYLKIIKIESKGFFGEIDYVFEKLKDNFDDLKESDSKLLNSLFSRSHKTKIPENIEIVEDSWGEGITKRGTGILLEILFIVCFGFISIVILYSGLISGNNFTNGIFFLIVGYFLYFIVSSVVKMNTNYWGKYKTKNINEKYFQKELLIINGVKMSSLRNNFYRTTEQIVKNVNDTVVKNGYFAGNPNKTRSNYVSAAFLIFFASIFLSEPLSDVFSPLIIVVLIISAVIIFVFSFIMPKKTEKGMATYEYILGLKDYLQIAEKDRINFHNAPEKRPEIFEKFLPYAMVLGVEKAWAKEFEGVYTTPPSWYSDTNGGMFNAIVFTNSMNSFSSHAGSTLTSAPGGSSGSGGGGSSGGGGGGGGGGSH